MTAYNIAIVGGGAVGVCVFNELVDQLVQLPNPERYNITIYDKTGVFGGGLAYGTQLDAHILNMPANSMSAKSDDPQHFIKWLKEPHSNDLHSYFNIQARGNDFVPRSVFGLYLEDVLDKALDKAQEFGISTELKQDDIINIQHQDGLMSVDSSSSHQLYNQTILCLGNQPPSVGSELCATSGYFHQPWPEGELTKGIPKDSDVNILGSSLSAVDTLLTLLENGHKGPINFISRNGLLPKVRSFPKPYKLTALSLENVQLSNDNEMKKVSFEKIVELFQTELAQAGIEVPNVSIAQLQEKDSPLKILEADIQRVQEGKDNYFAVLKAVDDVASDLWHAMSLPAKQTFDEHYKTLWNMYDYAMPMQNAQKVLQALQSGQLSVRSGFNNIEYNDQEKMFVIRCSDNEVFQSKYVVNAIGGGCDLTKMQSPLIQNALKNDVFKPHPLGGIDVDFDTGRVKDKDNNCSDILYAVGSLTRGVHFYTNSILENAKASKAVAFHVCNTLLSDNFEIQSIPQQGNTYE
ncbi:MAG: hypothetical protein COB14_07370 [Alphaproteobacteria bacterium]|nr:MAG: hypothetical protein COB14_07370 [Alphaproteobacteria bacterium]